MYVRMYVFIYVCMYIQTVHTYYIHIESGGLTLCELSLEYWTNSRVPYSTKILLLYSTLHR